MPRGLAAAGLAVLLAGLAVALAGVYMLASERPPPPLRGVAAARAEAVAYVEPVRLLGGRGELVFTPSNASGVRLPLPVTRGLELRGGFTLNGVEAAGPGTLRVDLLVHGFRVRLLEERFNGTSFHAYIDLGEARRLAEEASLEAGLPRPRGFRLEAVAELPVRLGTFKSTAGTVLRLEADGAIATLELETRDARLEAPAAPAEGGRGAAIAAVAAGAASIIAGGALYAYASRPRSLLPRGRTVEARLPPGLPRVAVADPRVVAEMAEKLDAPILLVEGQACIVDRGVAYCAQLGESRGGKAAPPRYGVN